jgi:hypothetical protein
MTRQTINTGTIANDGSGDTLRTAGSKINANFSELYSIVGGDNLSQVTSLTDSGLDFVGSSFRTKLGFVEGTSEINITFPDSPGEVVLNTAIQTLTNKTMIAPHINSPIIDVLRLHDADSSHYYSLNAGNISANVIVHLPSIADSDTIVLNKQTATLTNKTLTTPAIIKPSIREWLADSNGNPVISFTSSGSTRNRIQVLSVAAGSAPSINTLGSLDANINLSVTPKGTGSVVVSKAAYSTATAANTTTASNQAGVIFLTGTATGTVTFADGTTGGETVTFIRRGGSGTITLTPNGSTGLAQGTSINFDPNDTCVLVWDTSTGWNVVGGYGYSIV